MIIKIKVHPNSGRQEIVKTSREEYEVWLKEKAVDGKANSELLKFLSKKFGVDWRRIKIKNPKSRVKIIEVTQ